MTIVHCSQCDHVHGSTRKPERPWEWRCGRFPTPLGYGFVSPGYAPDPPFERCDRVNAFGNCNRFEPLRRPPEATDHD